MPTIKNENGPERDLGTGKVSARSESGEPITYVADAGQEPTGKAEPRKRPAADVEDKTVTTDKAEAKSPTRPRKRS